MNDVPLDSLSESDRERVRYHLGYMGTSLAASIQIGIPVPAQTVFLLEQALENLRNAHSVERCRCLLDQLDQLEKALANAACQLGAEKLGELTLHPLRSRGKLVTDSIEAEYKRWASRLADLLGVPFYPFSGRFRAGGGPGSIVPVR